MIASGAPARRAARCYRGDATLAPGRAPGSRCGRQRAAAEARPTQAV